MILNAELETTGGRRARDDTETIFVSTLEVKFGWGHMRPGFQILRNIVTEKFNEERFIAYSPFPLSKRRRSRLHSLDTRLQCVAHEICFNSHDTLRDR